jgi:hypothetical protein
MPHRKISLQPNNSIAYVVHRSNAALVALSAFLDVSSLNLAVPQGAAIFCPAHHLRVSAVRPVRTRTFPGAEPSRDRPVQLPDNAPWRDGGTWIRRRSMGTRTPLPLVGRGMSSHAPRMFLVSEAEAAAIRAVFDQRGELSAAIELRRLFPGITDTAQARECVRTIAGWKPLPVAPRSVRRMHQRGGQEP